MREQAKDWAEAHVNGAAIRKEADRAWSESMKIHPKGSWREHITTAAQLQSMTFEDVKWVVPNLVPEGLTLLCGRPKIGKSWAGLDIGLAVSTGGECFGHETEQGDVLYAALEDNRRRLQRRIDKLRSPFERWPAGLTLTTQWRKLDKGGVTDIAEWIQGAHNPRLVILDTLAGVKPDTTKEGYAADYKSLTDLHRLANDIGIGVLVLHHTRKLEADDPLDTISGTLGLAGCADTALVFVGSSQGMTLHVRGRDIEEAEHAVVFDKQSCRWVLMGSAAEVQKSDTRQAILTALKASLEPLGPQDIASVIGLKEGVVKQRLFHMVADGEVRKVGRGRYTHPDHPVTSVTP